MAKGMKNPTKVVTGRHTVFSYLNVNEPKTPMGGGTPKYSVSLIIPKSDTVTIAKIRAAIQAAYDEGEPWLDELKEYLYGNYQLLMNYFERELPQFPVSKLEGTYLVWVDVSALKMPSMEIEKSLIEEEKVWINGGTMYGRDGFVRINLACPRARLEDGLKRIVKGFNRLLTK